jgi:hypothetical protein
VTALREHAADVLHLLGRFGEATDWFEALLAVVGASDPLGAARIHRKIATACAAQQHMDKANQQVEEARRLLDTARAAGSDDWWREYFAVELFRISVYYAQARLEEMAEVIARLTPQIESHATLRERGVFNRNVMLLRLREQRYRPDAGTVELAALAAKQLREAGDASEACFARFGHAFTELWSGAIDDAARDLQEVLAETVRLGDAERNLLCLTYLAVTARLRGDVDTAQAFAEAAMAAARTNGSLHYEGMANANLAWVAWRRGDAASIDARVSAASKQVSPHVKYPFVWLHALVGLARAVEAMDLDAALAYAQSMTDWWQQVLHPDVQMALDSAIKAPTLATMAAVVDASRRAGYL